MTKILEGMVSGDALVSWLVIAFLVGYFLYKEWPEFQRRISHRSLEEAHDRTLSEKVDTIEADVRDIKAKIDRDYHRINDIERELSRHRKDQARDREEMQIIMRGVLAALQGLKEQGCDGTVTETADEISQYLNKKAHEPNGWED